MKVLEEITGIMVKKKKNSQEKSDNQEGMTIKEVAEKVGLTPRTIRYYEEIGILNGIKRDPYSHRRYTQKDLYRLTLTKRAKELLHLSLNTTAQFFSCAM